MVLPLAAVLALAEICAPSIAPTTMASIVRVESGFDPLIIGINAPRPRRLRPRNLLEAITTATRLIQAGSNVDLGLGQVNSANLARLGLSVADAFDPCHNLRASGRVLLEAYQSQAPEPGQAQAALRTALSIYNTGRTDRGFRNGYVAKVRLAAGITVPALRSPEPPSEPPPPWDVFANTRARGRLVFASASPGDAP